MNRLKAAYVSLRRHPRSVLLLWALGAVVILACAVALSDPALVMFALDPELAAVLVIGTVAFLRMSAPAAAVRAVVFSIARLARRGRVRS